LTSLPLDCCILFIFLPLVHILPHYILCTEVATHTTQCCSLLCRLLSPQHRVNNYPLFAASTFTHSLDGQPFHRPNYWELSPTKAITLGFLGLLVVHISLVYKKLSWTRTGLLLYVATALVVHVPELSIAPTPSVGAIPRRCHTWHIDSYNPTFIPTTKPSEIFHLTSGSILAHSCWN
jgi:hypothetical protein